VPILLALRAVEGLGFLLASMPAPALIRRLVAPRRLSTLLGLWGAYMPLGTALALLLGPIAIALVGWQGWWWVISTVSLALGLWIFLGVPALPAQAEPAHRQGWRGPIVRTLLSPGAWLVSLCFAMYSGQWLALIGFLPSVYAQAGFTGAAAGLATALAAAVNIVGNVAAGRLLHRGVAAHRLLYVGFAALALGALVAFAPLWSGVPSSVSVGMKYGAVLAFSAFGGLIPGTLFTLAVRLAPDEHTVSSTVGWMQQWSSAGQFAGPPLVALLAVATGGWELSWIVTGGCAAAGLLLAHGLRQLLRRYPVDGAAWERSPKI
jgi:cyanate permease